MYVEDNILVDEVKKGIPYSLAVESTDPVFAFDELLADLKYTYGLQAPYVIRLSPGNGLAVTDTELGVYLSAEQTKALKARHVYMDVKGKNAGGEPELLFTVKLMVEETVTDL